MPNRKLLVAGASVIALSLLGCGQENKPESTASNPPPPRVATGPDSSPPPAAPPSALEESKRSESPSETPKKY